MGMIKGTPLYGHDKNSSSHWFSSNHGLINGDEEGGKPSNHGLINGDEEGGEPSRGNYCLLQTQSHHGLPFYALGWVDRKVKTIISNVGSTNPGSTNNRLSHKKLVGGVWEATRDPVTINGRRVCIHVL